MQGEEEECVFLLMECLRVTIEGVVVCLSIHLYLSIFLLVCLYLFIPLLVFTFWYSPSVCLLV